MTARSEREKGIEKRIDGVSLDSNIINSSYRASLHRKLSGVEIPLSTIRQQLFDPLFLPVSSEISYQIHELQNYIWDNFSDREIIQLSPVGIFGLDQHITKSSPLKIAHVASKSADIVADPVVQLTVEAMRRRLQGERNIIKLGTFQRCLRLQKYNDPSRKPIFEMFGTLNTAINLSEQEKVLEFGKLINKYVDFFRFFAPEEKFEVVISNMALSEYILEMFRYGSDEQHDNDSFTEKAVNITNYFIPEVQGNLAADVLKTSEFETYISDIGIHRFVAPIRKLINNLSPRSNVSFSVRLDRAQGIGHYNGLAFMVFHDGIDLVDGGETNWLSKLTSNSKESSFVSGCGTELYAQILLSLADLSASND